MSGRRGRNAGALRWAWTALAVVAIGLVAFIATGAFDPRPLGPLVSRESPGVIALPTAGEATFPLADPFDGEWPDRFSLRLTAAHAGGDQDSGYGLVLGDAKAGLGTAVSPLGYVAVWKTTAEGPAYLVPWQPWPHTRPGAAANELWIDLDGTTAAVWLNRERLWQGQVAPLPDGAALWLEGYAGGTSVDFQTVEWFSDRLEIRD